MRACDNVIQSMSTEEVDELLAENERLSEKLKKSEATTYYCKWRKNNLEKVKGYRRKYYEKHSKRAGEMARVARQCLIRFLGGECLCCGTRGDLVVDHIIPVARGGLTTVGNFQVLCRACNGEKYTNTIDYRLREIAYPL